MVLWIVLPLVSSTFYSIHLVLNHFIVQSITGPLSMPTRWDMTKVGSFWVEINGTTTKLSTLWSEHLQFDRWVCQTCQSQCYCLMQHTYQRDAPQPPCCCCCCCPLLLCHPSSAAAVLHKCNWCSYVMDWVRLHCCTLPVLLLKLLL